MDIKLSKASRENARLQALLGRVQSEAAEDKERLELEASQVKAMYRTVVEESDNVAAELRNETRRFEAERAQLQKFAKVGQAKAALAEEDVDKIQLQQQVHDRELDLAESLGKIGQMEATIQRLEHKVKAAESDLEGLVEQKKGGKWFKR